MKTYCNFFSDLTIQNYEFISHLAILTSFLRIVRYKLAISRKTNCLQFVG